MKKILNTFSHAVAAASGTIMGARGGNDAYDWIKSGEAKKAVTKWVNGVQQSAEAAFGAHEQSSTRQGATSDDTSETRARVSAKNVSAGDSTMSRDEAAELEQLSEDDIAALRARRHATSESVVARCTYCSAPKNVGSDASLTQCMECGKRFWIDATNRG